MALTLRQQLRAARAMLGWSQADLAERSGISKPTIARMEIGDGRLTGRHETVMELQGAIEKGGVEFVPENGGGPGVRLRRKK